MNYNKATIGGNLTRDPELRFTPSGVEVCEFSVAVNERYKTKNNEQRERTDYIDCVAWGTTGKNIAAYFGKGGSIFVEGKLRLETWDDKTTGQKRSRTRLQVDGFQFVGKSGKDRAEGGQSARRSTAPAAPAIAGDGPPDDDDVPF